MILLLRTFSKKFVGSEHNQIDLQQMNFEISFAHTLITDYKSTQTLLSIVKILNFKIKN